MKQFRIKISEWMIDLKGWITTELWTDYYVYNDDRRWRLTMSVKQLGIILTVIKSARSFCVIGEKNKKNKKNKKNLYSLKIQGTLARLRLRFNTRLSVRELVVIVVINVVVIVVVLVEGRDELELQALIR